MNTENQAYPVTLRGELTIPPSRGWWLLKWLLFLPHFVCLIGLWVALVVVCIISFFAIVFTGRHPKGLFDFKVGVLRWTWRVFFYSYGALGTDKYPPFSLKTDPDYPADLDIPYPEKLSRGLVWVKWLLAIPHYFIVEILSDLNAILVFVAGICLLFSGRYPKDLFKLVIGLNRWSYRVSAYLFLMTDEYPPFRLWDD